MKGLTRARLALVLVAVAAMGLATTAAARTHAKKAGSPITIGWAYDSKGAMAPFDGPALAAAELRVKQVNAAGGVNGRPLVIKTCDTQGNKPAIAKSCADSLISGGANIIFTTCDVDLAAPVVQESINAGLLTVAPCIGTDQMGPKRFGPKGTLAFSFGNVAQDEGSAMAQYAWGRGWRTAALATDTVIVYFKDVVEAFKARWTAARREDRRPGDVPVARQHEHLERRQQMDGPEPRRVRHVDGRRVRRTVDARVRAPLGREQHADPQLVGRRRDVLAAEEPAGDELLLRHVRVHLR